MAFGFGLLPFLSAVFGWIYTVCWSLSFYPQPLLNFRRRSTSGSTVDFPFANTLGFLAYLVSNTAFYSSLVIRDQYALRNHGLTPTVAVNDILFAAHALLLCLVTVTQYLLPSLWGFEDAPGARPSRFVLGVAAGSALAVVAVVLVVAGAGPDADAARSWAWIDVVYTVSFVKLLITVIKYAPQLAHNYRNRSTDGWSIGQILLDFTGGLLSLAQLGIDAYRQHDWSGVTGNPVKFALGNASILYDLAFMFQHYLLYRRREPEAKDGEREALLERGERGRTRLD